jgi:hypothetical protein
MLSVGERSNVYTMNPTRPGFGTSRHWARDIGGWRYSFTLVVMPDGEIRWSVSRYDTPLNEYCGLSEQRRMQFGCYWHPYRDWTFTVGE